MSLIDLELLTDEQKQKFVEQLAVALDLQESEDGRSTWNCEHDYQSTHQILDRLSISTEDKEKIILFFRSKGGYCDCEVMLNVVCGDDCNDDFDDKFLI